MISSSSHVNGRVCEMGALAGAARVYFMGIKSIESGIEDAGLNNLLLVMIPRDELDGYRLSFVMHLFPG